MIRVTLAPKKASQAYSLVLAFPSLPHERLMVQLVSPETRTPRGTFASCVVINRKAKHVGDGTGNDRENGGGSRI